MSRAGTTTRIAGYVRLPQFLSNRLSIYHNPFVANCALGPLSALLWGKVVDYSLTVVPAEDCCMYETAFDLAKALFEYSNWEGVVDWFAGRPITPDNYPGYTFSYLLRQLHELLPDATDGALLHMVAEVVIEEDLAVEDAAAMLCIRLLEARTFGIAS